MRGKDAELTVCKEFSSDFLDHFFPYELRKAKAKEFVYLKQGNMSVKEYVLKFTQLSLYAPELISSVRSRMRKYALSLSRDLVLECKAAILNNDIDISRLVVYMQKVENKKKKQVELGERQCKKFKYVE